MQVSAILICAALLIAVSMLAMANSRSKLATPFTYGMSAVTCAAGLAAAISALHSAEPSNIVLPVGLPWLGAHFRVDSLAAVFLVVVNLGGLAASLFALGHGRHEHAPERVLPFFPAFLAG